MNVKLYEIFHILNCGCGFMQLCIKKPEKVRTLMGFEPMTSRYRCETLTN